MGFIDTNGIDLSGATGKLLQTMPLTKNPAPQAFATDTVNGHVFVLQLESSAGAPAGNMYLNRLDRKTGQLTGSMSLKGFGHGISLGAQPVGADTYLWTEVGPVHPNDGVSNGFGTAVTRFAFVNGATLDQADVPAAKKFCPTGARQTGPSVDLANNTLTIVYSKSSVRHFTRYDLTKATNGEWVEVGGTFTMPAGSETGLTFQGYTTLNGVLYVYQWKKDPVTTYPGTAYITSYSLDTKAKLDSQVVTGADGLERREPEGLAVEVDPGTGRTRLLFGFSDTVPGTTGRRNVTIGWYPTVPPVDGVQGLTGWEDLTLATGVGVAGGEVPRGRLVVIAGTTYLQLRGRVNCGLTGDAVIATLPQSLRPTRPARQSVPRNMNLGRGVCQLEANRLGELWAYGAAADNAITWIDLDCVSVSWR
ncbi:phage baseplate protein [Streptomyces sp. NPDC055254]